MSELKNNIYTWFSFKELALLKEGVKETDYRVKEAKFAAITTAVGISEDPSEEEVIEKCEEQLKHKEFYDYTSDIDKRELLNRLHSDLTLRDSISDQDKDKYKEVLESIWNNPDFSSYFSLYSIKDVDKENHRIFYPAVHAIVLAEMDKQKQTNYSKELVSIEELFNSYFDHEIKTTKRIRVTPEEKTYINNMPRGTWAHFIREWEIEESKGIKRAYPFSAQETILPSKVIRTNPSPDIAGERTQVFFEGSEEGKYLIDHGLDARFNYDPKGISLALTSLKKFHDEDNASSVTLYDMSIEAMRDWVMASIALEKEGLSIKVKIAPEMRNLVYTDEFKRQMEAYRNFIQPEENDLSSLSEKEANDSVSQEETEELVKLREKAQQAKQFVDEMELSENKLITPLKNLKEETLQQLVEKGIDIDRIPAFNALFSTQEKLREENDKLIMDVINNAKNFEQLCQKYFSEINNGTNSISSKENVATAEANLDASIEEWNKFARLNWENIKDVSDILDTKEIATNDLEDTKVEQEQYSSYAEEIQKEMETAQQWQKPLNEQEENDFNLKLLDAENRLQSEQSRNEQEENDLNLAKSKLIDIENRLQFERIRQEQLARDLAEEKAAKVQAEEQAIPVVDEEPEITEKAEVDTTTSDEELKTNSEQDRLAEINRINAENRLQFERIRQEQLARDLAEEQAAKVQAEEQAIPVVDEEPEITEKAEVDTTTSDEELKTNNEQDRLAEINRINAENRLQFERIRQEQLAKELAEKQAAKVQAEEQAIPVVDEEPEITEKAEVDTTTSDEELKTNSEQDRLAEINRINAENRLQFERIRQEQLARDLAEKQAAKVQAEEQAIPVVDEEPEITEKAEVDTTTSDEELKTNNEQDRLAEINRINAENRLQFERIRQEQLARDLAKEQAAKVQAEEKAIPVVDEEPEITEKAEVDTTTSDEELKTNNEQDRLAEINRINAENRLQFERIRQEQLARDLAEENATKVQAEEKAEKIRREAAKEAESLAKNASKYALENEQVSKFLDNVINSLEEPYGNMENHNIKPSEIESSDEFIKFFNALQNQVSIYALHDYLSLDYAKKASAWSDLQTLAIDKKIDNKEIDKAKKEFKKAQDELSSFIEKNRNSEEKDFSVYLDDLKQLISKKIKVRESSLGSVDPEKLLSMEKRTPVKKETKNLFVDHPEYEGTHWIFDLETGMCILNDRTKEAKQEQPIENLPEDAQIYDYVPGKQETKKIVQDTVNGKAKFFYISVNAALKDLSSFIRFVEEAESMQVSFAVKGSEEEIKMLNLSIQQQKENAAENDIPLDHKKANILYDLAKTEDKERALKNKRSWVSGVKATLMKKIRADKSIPDDQVISYAEKLTDYMSKYQETLEQIIKQETRSLDKNMILTEVVKKIGTFEKFESGVNTIVIKRSNNIQNVAVGKASVVSQSLTEKERLSTKRSILLTKKTLKSPLKAKMYQKRQALALAEKNKSKD